MRGSRSAPGRQSGGACCARNRATGAHAPAAALGTLAALRGARLGIQRRSPNRGERAALQNAAPNEETGVASMCALPCGTRPPIFADA